ncbi:MAG: hypothetical protein DWQ49_09900 [Bacteroidetes bacterium]|nr:MAG: hypothetical protein DWQ49_09900 [Bacteroidota bacterium]
MADELDPITGFPIPKPNNNTALDRIAAGMALQNPISRYFDYSYVPKPDGIEDDPIYDPLSDEQTKGHDPRHFISSKSKEETAHILEQVKVNQRLYERAQGAGGITGEIAGVIGNPLLTVPALITGGRSLPAMVSTEMGVEVLNEAILHEQQPLRTKTESAINITSAGALTWIGGRFIPRGRVDGSALGEATGAAAESMDTFVPIPGREAKRTDDGVPDGGLEPGATPTAEPGAGDVKSLGPVGDVFIKIAPAGEVLSSSPSKTAKEAIQNLVDVPYRFTEGKAVPQSVESKIKQAEGDWASMRHKFDEEYTKYVNRGGKLSQSEFDIEVARAMRSGDLHDIPEVQASATYFRKFDDAYFTQAQNLGLYGNKIRSLSGAKSHLQRIYNRKAILENFNQLRRMLSSRIAKGIARSPDHLLVRHFDDDLGEEVISYIHANDIKGIEDRLVNAKVLTGDEIAKSGDDAIEKAADKAAVSVINRMLGGDPVDIANIDYIVPKAGSLHERTMNLLSDQELEPFLDNSALSVMSTTARQMTREIEMAKTFGSTDMRQIIKEISDEYEELLAKANPKDVPKLKKRKDRDIRIVQGLRDVVLGTYGAPKDPTSALVTMGRSLRIMAMMTYGANITSSSLSDIVSPALRHGLEPFKHGLKVLFSGVTKERIKDINRIGIAVESITSARAAAFTEMAFNTNTGHKALHAFGKWTGLNKFTDLTQGINAVSTSEMFLHWMRQYEKLTDKKINRLLDVGIDKEWSDRIMSQIKKHSVTKNGVTLPESYKWDDVDAARRFENAIRKETHTTTLMPGKGDIPLWMKTETGKFFSMFMSFMLSSTQRWIMSGLQRGEIEFLQGIMMISIAGGLVSLGKKLATGQEIPDDPINLIIDGMDRGGALGIMALPTGWIRQLTSGESSSRRVGRGMVEQFMIPAGANYAKEVTGTLIKLVNPNEEFTEDDTWRMIRAIPLANSFHAIDLLKRATE